MDVLNDIIGSLRMTGGVVIDAETHGDWCLLSRFNDEDCERFHVRGDDLVAYHYVRSGRLYASVDGAPAIEARAGDIILLPRNDPHLLYSRKGLLPVDSHDLIQQSAEGPAKIIIDGDGEAVALYCGYLGVSSEHHPLLDSLPTILKLDGSGDVHADWLETSMRLLNEARSSPEMVTRLSELFFAEAIRRYMDQLPPDQIGWLTGLKDPAVAKALSIIHSRYAEELDIETLARESGVSRTILGERFARMLGEPPMRYCARWRMRIAANMLRDGRQNSANVAYAVGFNSEAAFNRAFKREFGEPPATWRRRVEAEAKAQSADARQEAQDRQSVAYCTSSDGTRLAYAVSGEGFPLVKAATAITHLQHDWHSPTYGHWVTELSRSAKLIRGDMRGFGMSQHDASLSLDALVDDLATVIDASGVEQCDLLGLMHGAAVAIAYAARNPERVRKLVLVNSFAAGWVVRADPAEVAWRNSLVELNRKRWARDRVALGEQFVSLYFPSAAVEVVKWHEARFDELCTTASVEALLELGARIDVRSELAKVKAPTLVFHCNLDGNAPLEVGKEVAEGIAGAKFVVLDSANHLLLGDEPAWRDFVRITRDFLQPDESPVRQSAALVHNSPRNEVRTCRAPDGAELAYAISGDGFPVVKAPNWMTHLQHDWKSPVYGHWLQLFAEQGQVVRMDLRGYGMSHWDPPRFTFESIVSDLATVIDDANLEQCDLVGLSHGAAFAIAYAARHPERVRKLVLVNSFAAGWRVRADPEEVAWRESLLEMNRTRPAFRRSLLGEMFITLYFPSANEELIEWHNRLFDTLGPVRNIEPAIELVSRIDVRNELPKVRAETLVVHGTKDGNAPVAVGREVAKEIPRARFIELNSANHVFLADEQAWSRFAAEFRAFMRR